MTEINFQNFCSHTRKLLLQGAKNDPKNFSLSAVKGYDKFVAETKTILAKADLLDEWSVSFNFKTPKDLVLFNKFPSYAAEALMESKAFYVTKELHESVSEPKIQPASKKYMELALIESLSKESLSQDLLNEYTAWTTYTTGPTLLEIAGGLEKVKLIANFLASNMVPSARTSGQMVVPDRILQQAAQQYGLSIDQVADIAHSADRFGVGGALNIASAHGTRNAGWLRNLIQDPGAAAGVKPDLGSAGKGIDPNWLGTIKAKIGSASKGVWEAIKAVASKGMAWAAANPVAAGAIIVAALIAGAGAVVLKRRAERIGTLGRIARFLERRPELLRGGRAAGRDTGSASREATSRTGAGVSGERGGESGGGTTSGGESGGGTSGGTTSGGTEAGGSSSGWSEGEEGREGGNTGTTRESLNEDNPPVGRRILDRMRASRGSGGASSGASSREAEAPPPRSGEAPIVTDEQAWEQMRNPEGDMAKTNAAIRSQIIGLDKAAEWYYSKTPQEKAAVDAYTEDRTKSRKTFAAEIAEIKKELLALFGDYRKAKEALAQGSYLTAAGRGVAAAARHGFGAVQRTFGRLFGRGETGQTNIRQDLEESRLPSEDKILEDLFKK